MLKKMLLIFVGIVTSAFGPGLVYFGLKALKEARMLRIPTSSPLPQQVDTAAADLLELSAKRAVNETEWAQARMASDEMRSFTKDNDAWSRQCAVFYEIFGWILIVAGIIVMIAWWRVVLNSLH